MTDILIVEDSLTQAEQLRFVLEENGFSVRHARNGNEALRFLGDRLPMAVVSDVNMPEMDGYELVRRLRAELRFSSLPVLLLTSLSDPEDVMRALETGADYFFTKPVNEALIIPRLRYIEENRDLQASPRESTPIAIRTAAGLHQIASSRLQTLNLLLSTYESAVAQNHRLQRAEAELRTLNESLEARVAERTAELTAEIAERARAEQRLRLQNTALASAANSIVITDAKGVITWVNPAFCKGTGYAASEAIGSTMRLLKSGQHTTAFYDHLWRTITSGAVWREEITNRKKDGSLYFAEQTITPVLSESGGITNYVSVMSDTTERRNLELRLRRNQRVESVGRLASGIAHDMNNMLTPILMSVPLLRRKLTPEQQERTLRSVESSVQRGAALVRQLLAFSRGVEGEHEPVRARELVSELVEVLGHTLPKNIQINTYVASGLPPIRGTSTQLYQVLLNLCVNARDAMPQGGKLTISAEYQDATGPDSGPEVVLGVADTGTGIPPEIEAKIFDPFFTTKEAGKGTGLGLANVQEIVKSHKGRLELINKPGEGANFRIHFPAMQDYAGDKPAAGAAAPGAEESSEKGAEQVVLIVDDEEHFRIVLKEHLEQHQYKVMTAQNGVEAVALFAAHAPEIKVVITEINMPVMDGISLARVLRIMNRNVRVMVSTSAIGSMDERPPEFDDLEIKTVLLKPYRADEVLSALSRELGAAKE